MPIRSPGICHCRARCREVRSPRAVEPGGDGSRLEIMREQSCNADDEGAHELQGQVAPFPCFGSVSPCYRRRAKPPDGRWGAPVSCFPPVAYGQITSAGLCPVSCFSLLFTGIYRQTRVNRTGLAWAETRNQEVLAPTVAGGPCARAASHALFQVEPERVGLV